MPAPKHPLRAAELLCARFSHDLGGMIGTLSGALELADDPAVGAEAVSLAQHSVVELRQRLELLRASWGPPVEPLTLPGLRSLAEGLPQARRCLLDDSSLAKDTIFSPRFARGVLNLLVLAAEALNGGGTVTLTGSNRDLLVAIAGPRAAWPMGLAACLTSEQAAWAALDDPTTLQMPLTILLSRSLGLRLSLLIPAGPDGPMPLLRLQEL